MRPLVRPRLAAAVASAALASPLAVAGAPAVLVAPAAAAETTTRQITYTEWDSQGELGQGRFVGTRALRGSLRLSAPSATLSYTDPHGYGTKTYQLGHWVSPWTSPGYAFEELIPSWDAHTPGDSWVQVQVRGYSESGRRSKWYTLGRWAGGDAQFHRTSAAAQSDGLARVDVDTLKTQDSVRFTRYQLRVTLLRRQGTTARPSVDTVGAMTSLLPEVASVSRSRPGVASGRRPLSMPRYSQQIHRGHYPQYDGGGNAWCSPTSVSMVLGRLGRLPSAQQYAWVPDGHPHPWVDHAARSQYDYGWRGAGNWPFSTAYAASRADSAFVTRLRNLREAEQFIRAGIPLVASVKFGRGELTGSPISASNGHLMVIVGFRANGDVVVNDPAAWTNKGVRRTYDRTEFENAWIPKSGGVVYVIHNDDQPLPTSTSTNW